MRSPETHTFVIWSRARPKAQRILEDIARRFTIQDVSELSWSEARFADNLTRFYLQQLPPGSNKEKHCGTGPFLVVVVEDPRPVHEPRATARGMVAVNAGMYDAKARYRSWTGGGHRVHASVSAKEADHDLLLLLGERAEAFRGGGWDGTIRSRSQDLLGTEGWTNLRQLLAAVELTMTYTLLGPAEALGETLPETIDAPIDLLVEDAWWAGVLLDVHPAQHEVSMTQHRIRVAGRPLTVRLHSGTEELDPAWYAEIVERRRQLRSGTFVPADVDVFYCLLHQVAAGRLDADVVTAARLTEIAAMHSLPRGDYQDPAFSAATLRAFLRAHRYSYPGERVAAPVAESVAPARWRRLRLASSLRWRRSGAGGVFQRRG